ncbi:uncharacterized protein LOC105698755 [Orussus abietinus]|uniref:uncharacterized protein LOC105698755 n=1 Tax=Orussus abietinus TaxID=222816 RepID=UPI000626A7DE|nr:uncharacterized protein LOC105698755 [Orussus abietinus]
MKNVGVYEFQHPSCRRDDVTSELGKSTFSRQRDINKGAERCRIDAMVQTKVPFGDLVINARGINKAVSLENDTLIRPTRTVLRNNDQGSRSPELSDKRVHFGDHSRKLYLEETTTQVADNGEVSSRDRKSDEIVEKPVNESAGQFSGAKDETSNIDRETRTNIRRTETVDVRTGISEMTSNRKILETWTPLETSDKGVQVIKRVRDKTEDESTNSFSSFLPDEKEKFDLDDITLTPPEFSDLDKALESYNKTMRHIVHGTEELSRIFSRFKTLDDTRHDPQFFPYEKNDIDALPSSSILSNGNKVPINSYEAVPPNSLIILKRDHAVVPSICPNALQNPPDITRDPNQSLKNGPWDRSVITGNRFQKSRTTRNNDEPAFLSLPSVACSSPDSIKEDRIDKKHLRLDNRNQSREMASDCRVDQSVGIGFDNGKIDGNFRPLVAESVYLQTGIPCQETPNDNLDTLYNVHDNRCRYSLSIRGPHVEDRGITGDLKKEIISALDTFDHEDCDILTQVLDALKYSSKATKRFLSWLFDNAESMDDDEVVRVLREVAINPVTEQKFRNIWHEKHRGRVDNILSHKSCGANSHIDARNWRVMYKLAKFLAEFMDRTTENSAFAQADNPKGSVELYKKLPMKEGDKSNVSGSNTDEVPTNSKSGNASVVDEKDSCGDRHAITKDSATAVSDREDSVNPLENQDTDISDHLESSNHFSQDGREKETFGSQSINELSMCLERNCPNVQADTVREDEEAQNESVIAEINLDSPREEIEASDVKDIRTSRENNKISRLDEILEKNSGLSYSSFSNLSVQPDKSLRADVHRSDQIRELSPVHSSEIPITQDTFAEDRSLSLDAGKNSGMSSLGLIKDNTASGNYFETHDKESSEQVMDESLKNRPNGGVLISNNISLKKPTFKGNETDSTMSTTNEDISRQGALQENTKVDRYQNSMPIDMPKDEEIDVSLVRKKESDSPVFKQDISEGSIKIWKKQTLASDRGKDTSSETLSEGELNLPSSCSFSLGEIKVLQSSTSTGKTFEEFDGTSHLIVKNSSNHASDTSNSLPRSLGEVYRPGSDSTEISTEASTDAEQPESKHLQLRKIV